MLYIVSTPIGNLDDITLRALKVLFSVPVILAEDTRRTGNLIDYFSKQSELMEQIFKSRDSSPLVQNDERRGGKPRFIPFHEHNENYIIDEVMMLLQTGIDIALVSDAGTPLVSDPGFKLVRRCIDEEIRVVSVPGPSAWLTAITTSGVPMDRVMFLGYLPPKTKRREKELEDLKQSFVILRKSPTVVLYEAPHRLVSLLRSIELMAGDVEVTLASELTKLHEKVDRKSVSIWINELEKSKKIKGEYVVLFRF